MPRVRINDLPEDEYSEWHPGSQHTSGRRTKPFFRDKRGQLQNRDSSPNESRKPRQQDNEEVY